jgi:fluoride ion exporter CrcB/FEX
MEALLVLGIIPGTNIQVGFLGWFSLFSTAAITYYLVHRERRMQTIRFILIRLSLALTVRRLQRA